ncbi:uncharacterized protein ARMOST_13833 [Armillaria ostoyae]|uniref:Uncharacterized protein n=1 Tax=Armillaria ostoyae TaxID=47428 RepID=A0A284RNW1_ARMOS|nr:uncharacterized protein ARMOST_13833 [Armillaria ostoyae]
MADDVPWTECQPELIRKPKVFKRDSNDIKQFITACQVAFAQSYFEDKALDWWMLELEEMESDSWGKY